jgi:hypothetical protein
MVKKYHLLKSKLYKKLALWHVCLVIFDGDFLCNCIMRFISLKDVNFVAKTPKTSK